MNALTPAAWFAYDRRAQRSTSCAKTRSNRLSDRRRLGKRAKEIGRSMAGARSAGMNIPTTPDITQLGIATAAAGLRAKTFSAVELAQAHLTAIEQHDPALHCYLAVNAELALDHAAEVDQALAAGESLSPLAGIPIAVKDNFAVHGLPATAASKILANVEPAYEATVVARLRAAGATILGKTNLDDLPWLIHRILSVWPDKNPAIPRVPGGSLAVRLQLPPTWPQAA